MIVPCSIKFLRLCPGPEDGEFGTFGYDQALGRCGIKKCVKLVGFRASGLYFLGACLGPCLVILASYILLAGYITVQVSMAAS